MVVWRTTAFSEPRQRVRSRRHAATCTSQRFPRESDADGRCGSPEDHNQLGGTTRPAAATCKRRKGRPRPLLPRSREPTCGGAVLRRALKMPALMVFAPHCSVCKSRRAAHVRFACTSINCPSRLSIPLAAFSRFYGHNYAKTHQAERAFSRDLAPPRWKEKKGVAAHSLLSRLLARPPFCRKVQHRAPRAVVEAYSCAGSCTQHAHPASAHAHRPMPGIHARLCRSLCHGGPVPLL